MQLFCNPRNNILEFYNNLVQIQFTTSKRKLDIWYCKLGIQDASQVAERLKKLGILRILGNQKILEKSQNWVET